MHFVALPSSSIAQSVAEAFVIRIVLFHGPPRSIVTDRNPHFLHNFWQELNRLQGTTLTMSTVYHPQTDGQFEALNKCVEQYYDILLLMLSQNGLGYYLGQNNGIISRISLPLG